MGKSSTNGKILGAVKVGVLATVIAQPFTHWIDYLADWFVNIAVIEYTFGKPDDKGTGPVCNINDPHDPNSTSFGATLVPVYVRNSGDHYGDATITLNATGAKVSNSSNGPFMNESFSWELTNVQTITNGIRL